MPGSTPKLMAFQAAFEDIMGSPLPLEIPPNYQVLETAWHQNQVAEMLIGSELARRERMLTQGDVVKLASLPDGFFLAGFRPQSNTSLAFYWCEVGPQRRVFFRFPTVTTPDDGEIGRARVLSFLESYRRLFHEGYDVRPVRLVAHDAMGNASYELELEDGRRVVHRESLLRTGDFEWLVRQAASS